MEPIVTTAIIGTGQHNKPDTTTGTPIDTLATQLPEGEAERSLLLTAGAWAIYRQAGRKAESIATIPQPACTEILTVCTPQVAQILHTLFQGNDEYRQLLPEALALLKKAGQRLPYELLPAALTHGAHDKPSCIKLLPVLGERGTWLAQFNQGWSWIAETRQQATQTFPTDAETIWQEGTLGQRADILRRLRAIDAAKAREWLQAVWKQEKVDTRATLLACFGVGISDDDLPLLTRAVEERGDSVRAVAVPLLTHLTTAPQTQLLYARADELFTYTNGKLTINPPSSTDIAWKRDVTMLKQPAERSGISYWLTFALSKVPPSHWEKRFSAQPAEILAALDDPEWGQTVVKAWSAAALFHNDTDWIRPLLNWLYDSQKATNYSHDTTYAQLIKQLPQAEAEEKVVELMGDNGNWISPLQALPRPWSDTFSTRCLQEINQYNQAFFESGNLNNNWYHILSLAASALSPASIEDALAPWEGPKSTKWEKRYWQQQVNTFKDLVHTRKILLEEIAE